MEFTYHHDAVIESDYDLVGDYNQDQINGFSEELIDSMIDLVQPKASDYILDAMAGNGNLTSHLVEYCIDRGLEVPNLCVMDISEVQCEFARKRMDHLDVDVVWGDMVSMTSFDSGQPLLECYYDKIMIKSGNHEIPLSEQQQLYANAFRMLKPGGYFINLGFLFDDTDERDEFREVARVKDRLAGMEMAVENRHFLTRSELYSRLQESGFENIQCGHQFNYTIHSLAVSQAYFRDDDDNEQYNAFQACQAKSLLLRRRGRIQFERDYSIMRSPGEMTIARRPMR